MAEDYVIILQWVVWDGRQWSERLSDRYRYASRRQAQRVVDAQLAKYPTGTMTMAQVMTWREYLNLRDTQIELARDPKFREPTDEN